MNKVSRMVSAITFMIPDNQKVVTGRNRIPGAAFHNYGRLLEQIELG
jgi:hypothetical protein